ncbi:stressosome-associated protein Prli42 [Virgibacillus soli]|uniref:Stressosome-associated protein Prli42 n=1 Tax=Paracerasibacillus soli TaxID=480284 RepID=A0ABU5CPT9_9BACI|nr:stressosome-associated protein Prli42 [Virgibacillus soli]MDY0408381.1 stressosome-associated protein Prli42 [Virgibacillus soli]
MSKNQAKVYRPKKSKRDRRIKIAIYVMIIAMLLSTLTAGLSFFL